METFVPEISIAELSFLLCLTCLSLAGGLIWACGEVAPRFATVRSAQTRGSHDR